MTFDNVVSTFEAYVAHNKLGVPDAKKHLLEFLDLEESDLGEFPTDVRIVLTYADFSPEITTTVLWLNEYGLDINCVRLRPYQDGARLKAFGGGTIAYSTGEPKQE